MNAMVSRSRQSPTIPADDILASVPTNRAPLKNQIRWS
jgi:hypothetical protein